MIDPRGMTLRQWADAVLLSTSGTWSFGKLDDEARWRDWLVEFLRANNFAPQILPDPYQFTDWAAWAMRAYPMLEVS